MKPPPHIIDLAIEEARRSPCAKSKRGCVVYRPLGREGGDIISFGHNSPPFPIGCRGDEACRRDCAKRCVHAEMRAIRGAVLRPSAGSVLQLVHIKVNERGEAVPGGGPSCWQCSREVADSGIIAGVWLWIDMSPNHPEWRCYSTDEFHDETLKACDVT